MATKAKRPKFKINDRVTIASYTPLVPAYGGKPFVGRGTILRVASITGTGSLRQPYFVHVTDDEGHVWQFPPDDIVLADESPSERPHAAKKESHEDDPAGHTRGVRAREIVRLAAEQVKDPSTRYWLLADERGTFEKAARKYLEEAADKARSSGMSNAKVNEEIAVMLALSAVEAFLKRARGR